MSKLQSASDKRFIFAPASRLPMVYGTVAVTGFTALVYEVVWQRYLANFLGSEAKATAFVLAVFLGGLACGYGTFGRVSRRAGPSSLMKIAGWAEFLIGAWAVSFPLFFSLASEHLGAMDPAHSGAVLWDFAVSCLLVGPPTFLMGGTLPLLTQALSENVQEASSIHARVYSINTGGAFLGCLAAGFWLLPTFGHDMTLMATGPLNLIAGLILIGIGSRFSGEKGSRPDGPAPAKSMNPVRMKLSWPCLLAGLAGFCSITLQTLLIRIVGLSAGSSEYAFSMVVSLYILLLALGASRVVGTKRKVTLLWRSQLVACLGVLFLYWLVPQLPYLFHLIRILFSVAAPSFYVFLFSLMVFLGVCLLPSVGSMGRTMPALFDRTKSVYGDLGAQVGHLYLWNTVGCVFGTLVGGYLLLNWLSIDTLLLLCLFLLSVSVAVAAKIEGSRRAKFLFALPVLAGMAFFLPRWPIDRLAIGVFRLTVPNPSSYLGPKVFYQDFTRGLEVLARRDDPNTSVAVVENEPPGRAFARASKGRSLMVNGKSDGNTIGDLDTMLMLAHLPLFLSAKPVTEAAVVGFGLGVTVGSLTLPSEVKRIDLMEISPAVREFSHYFDSANYSAGANAKVNWNMGDAYRFLTTRDRRYSIIVSEPSNPWVIGVERLYTQEFYQKAKERLEPGGIYTQWIGTYNLALSTAGMIVRTFSSVFKETRIFSTGAGDLILMGSDRLQVAAWPARFATLWSDPAIRADLARIGVKSAEALFLAERSVSPEMFLAFPIHTLVEPKLSYAGARDTFSARNCTVEEFEKDPKLAPWTFRARRRLLGFQYLLNDRGPDPKEFQAKVCSRTEPGFFEGWQSASALCMGSLLSLAERGLIPVGIGFTTEDRQTLKLLAAGDSQSVSPPGRKGLDGIRRAVAAIDLFIRGDTPLLPLRPKKLFEMTGVCFEAYEGFETETKAAASCLYRLSEVFYSSGSLDLGAHVHQRIWERYRTVLTGEQLENLAALQKESALAWKTESP